MVNLNPEGFTQGGLLDDVTAEILEAKFAMFDYNGAAPPTPAIYAKLSSEDGEAEQYWSVGSAKDWEPSKDGKTLEPLGSASTLRLSSNGAIFLKNLVDAGFDSEKLEPGDITVLTGLVAHFIRVPAPKRGIKKEPREDGKQFEDTVLVVDQIISMPGEKKKTPPAKGKPAAAKPSGGKAKPKAAAEESSGADGIEAEAIEYVLGKLAEAGEPIPKKTLTTQAFKDLEDNANRQKIVQLVFADAFLGGDGVPWSFEDGMVSM